MQWWTDCFSSLRQTFHAVVDCFTSLRQKFHAVMDCFTSLRQKFHAVMDCFTSLRQKFHAVVDCFTSLRQKFHAVVERIGHLQRQEKLSFLRKPSNALASLPPEALEKVLPHIHKMVNTSGSPLPSSQTCRSYYFMSKNEEE